MCEISAFALYVASFFDNYKILRIKLIVLNFITDYFENILLG